MATQRIAFALAKRSKSTSTPLFLPSTACVPAKGQLGLSVHLQNRLKSTPAVAVTEATERLQGLFM